MKSVSSSCSLWPPWMCPWTTHLPCCLVDLRRAYTQWPFLPVEPRGSLLFRGHFSRLSSPEIISCTNQVSGPQPTISWPVSLSPLSLHSRLVSLTSPLAPAFGGLCFFPFPIFTSQLWTGCSIHLHILHLPAGCLSAQAKHVAERGTVV